jgi:uncharacterized membrane protein YczE
MGGAYLSHLSYGNIVVITGLIIIVIDFALKEKVGFGTILNAILIGIGFILQFTFKLLHFDVKNIEHESISDTVKFNTSIHKQEI